MTASWWICRADPGDAEALVALGRSVGGEPEGWLITTAAGGPPPRNAGT